MSPWQFGLKLLSQSIGKSPGLDGQLVNDNTADDFRLWTVQCRMPNLAASAPLAHQLSQQVIGGADFKSCTGLKNLIVRFSHQCIDAGVKRKILILAVLCCFLRVPTSSISRKLCHK